MNGTRFQPNYLNSLQSNYKVSDPDNVLRLHLPYQSQTPQQNVPVTPQPNVVVAPQSVPQNVPQSVPQFVPQVAEDQPVGSYRVCWYAAAVLFSLLVIAAIITAAILLTRRGSSSDNPTLGNNTFTTTTPIPGSSTPAQTATSTLNPAQGSSTTTRSSTSSLPLATSTPLNVNTTGTRTTVTQSLTPPSTTNYGQSMSSQLSTSSTVSGQSSLSSTLPTAPVSTTTTRVTPISSNLTSIMTPTTTPALSTPSSSSIGQSASPPTATTTRISPSSTTPASNPSGSTNQTTQQNSNSTTLTTPLSSSSGGTSGMNSTTAAISTTPITTTVPPCIPATSDLKCPTILMQRIDNGTFFNRSWADMKCQFGSPSGNYWIGLDTLHNLTTTRSVQLMINLTDLNGILIPLQYSTFQVGDESSAYQLNIGNFSSSANTANALLDLTVAVDAFAGFNGTEFTTYDRTNSGQNNCAVSLGGSWWYIPYNSTMGCQAYNQCGPCLVQNPFVWQQAFNARSLTRAVMYLSC